MRGEWKDLTVGNHKVRALATLHPAYLLRQPATKQMAWRDMLSLKQAIEAEKAEVVEPAARIWSEFIGKRKAARRVVPRRRLPRSAEGAMSPVIKIYALFIGSALLMFGGGCRVCYSRAGR